MERDDRKLVGSTLGSYRLLELLGSGGMAAVYRAAHVETGVEHALKILRTDDAALDRFGREAVALSRLVHPNVVSVIDFGVTADKVPFLVMEYVRGPTLEDLIQREAPMSLARAARFARDIALALDEAHAMGFVHRDVKPTNIMIPKDEHGREAVKLLDFGVVGLAQSTMGKRLTATGTILGTPKYMAPEQCAGEDPSFASDRYALGLVLYEMITGRAAFEAKSASAMMIQQLKGEVPPLPKCGGLEDLVHRLLEKDPARRPQSDEMVIAELDYLLERLPDAPLDIAEIQREPSADEAETVPLPALAASLADTVPVWPMAEAPLQTDSLPDPAEPAPVAPRTSPTLFLVIVALLSLIAALLAIVLAT